MHGAIKRALQVAKMRSGQAQPANIPPRPQAPPPKREDMPVDPTRSKSAQERQKFQDGGSSIMFQKEEQPRKNIPLRPYEPRFNPKSGKLDAADRKDIGFYGPIKNPMTDHEITEYSSDRDFQYPTVYEGMSDKDRAAIMLAERLGKNAPKGALSDVDDRAYAQAQKRKAKGRSPFYEPGKDPYPKWSPEQHWDEPTGMPKDDGVYYADGGTVERPTKMNDKVKHALDVALSETHPKRFHHTLARTGYAEGGLPDMNTSPADLANEVPYTHEKALASQFDVAKSAPFKPKGITLGATKIAPPKKVGFHAPRGPRSDIGKLRLRKNISVKPKKLKFALGGHPEIDDALRLASRTMSDMAKHIGDEGVHGASMQQGSTSTIVKEKLPGKKSEVVYEHHAKTPTETETFASGGGAWTRKEGQNPEGGLNAKGRASARAEGHNLKPPAPHPKTEKDAGRRKSFCSRMKGMKAKLTSSETANDPDSRINKSLRAWNCRADGGRLMHQDIIDALNLAGRRRHFADGGMGAAGPNDLTLGGRGNDLITLYRKELGRDPDSEGMNYWLQQLNNGMSIDQVQQAFDQSQEGQAYNQQPPRFSNDPRYPHVGMPSNDMPPQLLDGNPYAGGTPLNDVIPNYPVTMVPTDQPPYDPYAGNMPYNDVIMAPRERLTPPGGNAPAGMGDVRYFGKGVLPPGPLNPYLGNDMGGTGTKAGGQGIGGQGPMPQRTPLEEIDLMYRSQLGREADEGGRNYWVQQLQNGMSPDQIQQIFRNTQEGQEYQKRMIPMTDPAFGGGNGTKAGGGGQPSFPFPTPGYPQNPNAPMPNMPQGNPGYPGGGNGTKAGGGGYPSGGTGTKAGGGGGYPGYPSGGNVMF